MLHVIHHLVALVLLHGFQDFDRGPLGSTIFSIFSLIYAIVFLRFNSHAKRRLVLLLQLFLLALFEHLLQQPLPLRQPFSILPCLHIVAIDKEPALSCITYPAAAVAGATGPFT